MNTIIKSALTYLVILTTLPTMSKAQKLIVGFYNFENFYDTTDQSNIVDEEFLPGSVKKYTSQLYNTKSNHLASVLYGLGKLDGANGLALLGIAEIENKIVLNKIITNPLLQKYHYQFIHFDSKDIRGIDVALLYNPALFTPYQYRPFSLTDSIHFNDYATRDILFVKGKLNNTWVHILVNHWPSRRGGERKSSAKRIWAATVCKKIIDSVTLRDSTAKFIVMGDFNDNPNNKSLKTLALKNPFSALYQKGLGSMAYKDSWSLFDQILINDAWQASTDSTISRNNIITYYKSIIYKNSSMIETEGRYQGYPKRTWNGNQFRGGYSDHFPAILIFKQNSAEIDLK